MEKTRQQLRAEVKFNQELSAFFKKLSPRQNEFVNAIAEEKFRINIIEFAEQFKTIIKECSITAMKDIDVTQEQIEYYKNNINELVNEHINIGPYWKGISEMARKEFDKNLKGQVIKCVNEGMKRKQIIEKLYIEVPNISKNMISTLIDNVNEEQRLEKIKDIVNITEDEEINAAVEYILEEEKGTSKPIKETVKSKNLKAHQEITATVENAKLVSKIGPQVEKLIEESNLIKEVKEVKEEVKMSGLKVKSIVMVIEGANGEYQASKDGVILTRQNAQIDFKSIEELEKWTSEIKEVFKKVNEVA